MLVDHKRALRLASYFLQYPNEDWFAEEACERDIELLQNKQLRKCFEQFFHYVKTADLLTVCNDYVTTFDFSEQTSLYLSYSFLGEQKERGDALLKLKQFYEESGLELVSNELPDFLPIVLEYVAYIGTNNKNVDQLWKLYHKSFLQLHEELKKKNSPYKFLIESCLLVMKATNVDEQSVGGVS